MWAPHLHTGTIVVPALWKLHTLHSQFGPNLPKLIQHLKMMFIITRNLIVSSSFKLVLKSVGIWKMTTATVPYTTEWPVRVVTRLSYRFGFLQRLHLKSQSKGRNNIQRTIYSATTFLEKWFEKSGLRNLVREIWYEKSGWPEKNPSLQNHFSRTTFLHFSRKVVAE